MFTIWKLIFLLWRLQDPAVRDPAVRPGERFSDTLIRRSEEAYIQQRLREERVEAGIPVEEEPAVVRIQEDEESEFEEEYVNPFYPTIALNSSSYPPIL